MPFCTCALRMRRLNGEPGSASGVGPAPSGRSKIQFGASPTCSNRMFGPTRVSLVTSIRRQINAGSDSCASIRSALAMSGRVPPGRFASVTSLISIVGHSDRLIRNGPFRLSVRPVAACTARMISGL